MASTRLFPALDACLHGLDVVYPVPLIEHLPRLFTWSFPPPPGSWPCSDSEQERRGEISGVIGFVGPMMFSYDRLADECLDVLNKLPPAPKVVDPWKKHGRVNLYQLLLVNHDEAKKLQELWNAVHTVPE